MYKNINDSKNSYIVSSPLGDTKSQQSTFNDTLTVDECTKSDSLKFIEFVLYMGSW